MFPADRAVITLSGSFGTSLMPIAQRLAELVHLPLHAPDFTADEMMAWAEDVGTSDQFLALLMATEQGSETIEVDSAGHCFAAEFDELGAVNRRTVLSHAIEGGILIESCAAQILARRPNTLHVRLDGPLIVRIQRYADEHQLDPQAAIAIQGREAGIRGRLARWAYGYDPERLDAYDLVVNTCWRSPEVVTHMIAKAAEACTDLRIVGA